MFYTKLFCFYLKTNYIYFPVNNTIIFIVELLLKNVAKHVQLNKEEEQILLDSFVLTRHPSRTKLLKSGEICINSFFVVSGILRNYCLDDNQANEHTINFATTDWWIADMYSFLSQKPGNSYIEVVEDAIIMTQSREQQLAIFERIPKMERFFRILMERSLIANQQRLIDNMALSAEERYKRFCERFSTIKYNVPQKQIASYLGVTPEFFSKMKKKLLMEK